MKVMFFGDNVNSLTGYARQAREFIERFLKTNNQELYYIGDLYGTDPTEIQTSEKNVTFLTIAPHRGSDAYLKRIIAYINFYKPDVFFIIGNAVIRTILDKLHLIQFKKMFPDMKIVFYAFNEAEFLQTNENKLYEICDIIIPSSKFSKFQIEREGFKCVEPIYPGVDKEVFKPLNNKKELRKKYGYEEDDKIVFTYSRINPRKNCRNMVSAAYKMGGKIKFFLHLLELSQYEQYNLPDFLERICPLKHGIKDWEKYMKFSDNDVTDEELVEMINIADLMILPTRGEGFGFPIVEALCCGTPVMASNNSTIPEILDGYGIQMKCNDYVEMGFNCYSKAPDDKLIIKYIESFFSDEKFEKNKKFWSQRALDFRKEKEFSWDVWYNKLMEVIK